MFSLSALVNKAATSPAAPSPPATSDDSGLIDLNGLLAASKQAPAKDLVPAHVDIFPLGRPPLPSTEAVEITVAAVAATPVRKTRAMWIAGAGLLAVALAGGGWRMQSAASQSVQTAERGISAAAARQSPVIVKAPAPEAPILQDPEQPPVPVIRKPVIRPRDRVKTPPGDQVKTPPVDSTPCDLRCQMERAVKGKPKR